ncbi:MAG: hypothetical protein IJX98_06770, partial [Clostridia bacterium]|nr:hypothetical protein [Clostridia bacterium]
MNIDGKLCHDRLAKQMKCELAFDENRDFISWKGKIKEKLSQLLGLPIIAQNACPLELKVVETQEKEGYTQIRFEFESEYGSVVPCYLLIPDTVKEKAPVVITLQGHNQYGARSSIGEALCHETLDYDTGRGTFALQAVKRGLISLAIEQRGMGERKAMNAFDRRVSL